MNLRLLPACAFLLAGCLLSAPTSAFSERADLRPGERLEDNYFYTWKEIPFDTNGEAEAFAKGRSDVERIEARGDGFIAMIPVKRDLIPGIRGTELTFRS